MSISIREQQLLESIGQQLSTEDPHLALLMETFGRLTAGDEMPAREQLVVHHRYLSAMWLRRPSTRTLLVLWLALGLMLLGIVAVGAAINRHHATLCRARVALECTAPAVSPHISASESP